MAKQSNEAVLWSLFSAGGVVAALLIPVHLFLFARAFPLGWLRPPSYEHMMMLLRMPWVRIYHFLRCSVSLFLRDHRLRSRMYDGVLQWQLHELIFTSCTVCAVSGVA